MIKKIIILIFLVFIFISSTSLYSFEIKQKTTYSINPRIFGGENNDEGFSIVEANDSGYIIAGYTYSFGNGSSDAWIIKIDDNGNKIWDKTFGGNDYDGIYSITKANDGGYILAGYTSSSGSGFLDVWVIKIDNNGNKIWDKTYGGRYYDVAYSIKRTKDKNGYFLCGYTASFGAGKSDIWVIKIDNNGNKLWDNYFGGKEADVGFSIIETSDYNIVLTGYTGSFGLGLYDLWVIKLDKNGNIIWDKKFGGKNNDVGYSIIEYSDGNYIISGYTSSSKDADSDIWVLKIDKNGNKLWDKRYGGTDFDEGKFIIKTKEGNLAICGYTYSFGAGFSDAYILKLDNKGNKIIDKTYGGTNNDISNCMIETKDGKFIIVGSTYSFGAGKADIMCAIITM